MSEIIHWGIMKFGTKYYICNQAVKANEKKITDYHEKVTCKNCLRILKEELKLYSPKEWIPAERQFEIDRNNRRAFARINSEVDNQR